MVGEVRCHMGMVITDPLAFLVEVSLILVDVDLEHIDAEPLLVSCSESVQILHGGLTLQQHDRLTDGGSLRLERPAGLLLHQLLDLLQAISNTLSRPGHVVLGQLLTNIIELLQASIMFFRTRLDGLKTSARFSHNCSEFKGVSRALP